MTPSGKRPWQAAYCLLCLSACNPYERYTGEVNAGPVDPSKFTAAYLGEDGDPKMAGSGKFKPVAAKVSGKWVAYYRFPLPAAQAGARDPLQVSDLSPGLAYLFDPPQTGAFPATYKCRVPAALQSRPENCASGPILDGNYYADPAPCSPYRFNARYDAVRFDQQGAILTALPTNGAYLPIVAEVPVTSGADLDCQSIKSSETLLKSSTVKVPLRPGATGAEGWPSGRYFAWAAIDPSAEVLTLDLSNPDPNKIPTKMLGDQDRDPAKKGFGPQRFGWWNRFLVAFLDGGLIPRQVVADKDVVRLRAQRLYYPAYVPEVDDDGKPTGALADGEPGAGLDVLEGARGGDNYSPLCQLVSYDNRDAMAPDDPTKLTFANAVGDIDQKKVTETKKYIYCLQLATEQTP